MELFKPNVDAAVTTGAIDTGSVTLESDTPTTTQSDIYDTITLLTKQKKVLQARIGYLNSLITIEEAYTTARGGPLTEENTHTSNTRTCCFVRSTVLQEISALIHKRHLVLAK
ncbi:hypothetical protein NPIL_464761 [Nephila pilipes]|uniref:Uncharacterized protein n=1 Tax=Nephila pilipes TaxID=299642 RepID=A0A8X6TLW4_NEPPI|nr:hypothetical protein NPIL_464761 [Nephila pilipes]